MKASEANNPIMIIKYTMYLSENCSATILKAYRKDDM